MKIKDMLDVMLVINYTSQYGPCPSYGLSSYKWRVDVFELPSERDGHLERIRRIIRGDLPDDCHHVAPLWGVYGQYLLGVWDQFLYGD